MREGLICLYMDAPDRDEFYSERQWQGEAMVIADYGSRDQLLGIEVIVGLPREERRGN